MVKHTLDPVDGVTGAAGVKRGDRCHGTVVHPRGPVTRVCLLAEPGRMEQESPREGRAQEKSSRQARRPHDSDPEESIAGASGRRSTSRNAGAHTMMPAPRVVETGVKPIPAGVIGSSPKFRAVLENVELVAPVDCSVLIHGETGTGKEVIAQAIHDASQRSQHRFIAINCAAIPAALLESELFGHERGAFTGALSQRV